MYITEYFWFFALFSAEMFRGGMGGNMDRDFGRSEMALNRGFGDSFGRMGMVTVKSLMANCNVVLEEPYQKKRRLDFVWSSSSVPFPAVITARM